MMHAPLCFTPTVNCVCLAQLLALCGSVAFWQVSHLERSVSAELRRRRGEREEREEKEKNPPAKAKVMRWHKSACMFMLILYNCSKRYRNTAIVCLSSQTSTLHTRRSINKII